MLYYVLKTLFRLECQKKEGFCKTQKVGQKDEEKGRRKCVREGIEGPTEIFFFSFKV